jgi:FixJ family two-component response regulator
MPNKSQLTRAIESHAPSVFAGEIEGFTAKARLSRRESDIVLSLIRNITNSEEIAKSLGISTHTVNNHLKSIFEKTSTKSKTEILSTFLRFAADKMQNRGLFVRRPRVLVIDDEELICEFVVSGLRDRGVRAYPLTDPSKAVATISTLHIDFVVCDIRMPAMSGMDVLKAVRQAYRGWPYFLFITGYPDYSIEECLHQGAAGFIEKPLDVDKLFRTIMSHLVESSEERYELLDLRGAEPVVIDEPIQLGAGDLGFGGAFLPLESPLAKKPRVGVGSVVDVAVAPPSAGATSADARGETPIKVRGQVIWKRAAKEGALKAGVGVRFIDMSDKDQDAFDTWLTGAETRSFIPMGAGGPAVVPAGGGSTLR